MDHVDLRPASPVIVLPLILSRSSRTGSGAITLVYIATRRKRETV
jgi:hypothetical protein